MKITLPSTATLRRLGAAVISIYGLLSLKDVAPHLPTWVAGLMVAAAPVMEALQHYLDHPSTGTAPELTAAKVANLNAGTMQVHQANYPLNTVTTVSSGVSVPPAPVIDPLTGLPRVANPAPPAPGA